MADKEIKDFTQVASPALTDILVCQQSGTTYKQTVSQIFSNIANLPSASTLDGSETVFIRSSGANSKVTVDNLTDYILDNI